jgi:hypothetical protein
MDVIEIDKIFKKGLEAMKNGNYAQAEAFFTKAKNLTVELQELRKK